MLSPRSPEVIQNEAFRCPGRSPATVRGPLAAKTPTFAGPREALPVIPACPGQRCAPARPPAKNAVWKGKPRDSVMTGDTLVHLRSIIAFLWEFICLAFAKTREAGASTKWSRKPRGQQNVSHGDSRRRRRRERGEQREVALPRTAGARICANSGESRRQSMCGKASSSQRAVAEMNAIEPN